MRCLSLRVETPLGTVAGPCLSWLAERTGKKSCSKSIDRNSCICSPGMPRAPWPPYYGHVPTEGRRGRLASWDGGHGGRAVWREGFLSSFVNPNSTLADGVQFDTGSAWGWLQEGSWPVCRSPVLSREGLEAGPHLGIGGGEGIPFTCGF